MTERWISLDTDIFSHSLVGVEPTREFTRLEAWQWLIAHAAWKPHNVRNKGKLILLQRGQLPAARDFLAQQWRWRAKRVRIFLDQLTAGGMILKGQSKGHFANVITICNYDKYQLTVSAALDAKGQSRASVGPEQGQTFTKEDITTRAGKIGPARLYDLLCEAAGEVLCPMAKGMAMMAVSEPLGWLAAGADLKLDVLPAVQLVAKRAKQPGRVRSWGFFAEAVADRKAARLSGLPAVRQGIPAEVRASDEIRKMRVLAGVAA